MKVANFIPASCKVASRSILRDLKVGDEVGVISRSSKELHFGILEKVPEFFINIAKMSDDDVFVVNFGPKHLKAVISKRVHGKNGVASLYMIHNDKPESVNLVVRDTSSEHESEQLFGKPKTVMMFQNVVLDQAGNFVSNPTTTPSIPMKELTEKIVACHEMTGTLDWLKNLIQEAEMKETPDINQFHKNNR